MSAWILPLVLQIMAMVTVVAEIFIIVDAFDDKRFNAVNESGVFIFYDLKTRGQKIFRKALSFLKG